MTMQPRRPSCSAVCRQVPRRESPLSMAVPVPLIVACLALLYAAHPIAVSAATHSCSSSLECGLNGDCVSGSCRCPRVCVSTLRAHNQQAERVCVPTMQQGRRAISASTEKTRESEREKRQRQREQKGSKGGKWVAHKNSQQN